MHWYEEDVEKVEKVAESLDYTPNMVFYGSSSIRLWESLYTDFEEYHPANLGFGGSTLEACVYFFERILHPYRSAQQLVIYAGDNDLGDGKQPHEVLHYFEQLVDKINQFYEDVQVFYVSIKPSIARWDINDKIIETNTLIREAIRTRFTRLTFINIYDSMKDEQGLPLTHLYAEDGLHLSVEGYKVWRKLLKDCFSRKVDNKLIHHTVN